MKTFVAGATGVLGRRVVPLLVAAGHEVTAVARSDTRASNNREGRASTRRDGGRLDVLSAVVNALLEAWG